MSNVAVLPQKELITFDANKLELIRKTVANQLTQNEFDLFISIAKARGLDPVLGQIHAVVRGQGDKAKVNFQVGIDGFRLIAARTGEFGGRDETAFEYKNGKLDRAKVTVFRFVNGVRCPWTASARWDEYFPGEQMGFMWKKMPETMLEKCAEAKALRMAFPNDLFGLYEDAEMDQAGPGAQRNIKDVTPGLESNKPESKPKNFAPQSKQEAEELQKKMQDEKMSRALLAKDIYEAQQKAGLSKDDMLKFVSALFGKPSAQLTTEEMQLLKIKLLEAAEVQEEIA